ncbi:unnamed protein product [Urochloa humidicola]
MAAAPDWRAGTATRGSSWRVAAPPDWRAVAATRKRRAGGPRRPRMVGGSDGAKLEGGDGHGRWSTDSVFY